MRPVQRREDIPAFTGETEEREFWDTHYLADEYRETTPRPKESIVDRIRHKRSSAHPTSGTGE